MWRPHRQSFKLWHDSVWRVSVHCRMGEPRCWHLPATEHPSRPPRGAPSRSNPIAAAMVERAAAIDSGDAEALITTADALDAAGARYQRARTLVFAGGEARAEGREILAAIGAAPMAEPD